MQTDNTVKLKVNGKIFQGWLSVEITSSLQSLARTFAVSATRSRSASGDLTDGISAGNAVEVFIGDDKVLTGYVMTKTVSYSSASVSIEISGASKPVDLEQCTMPDGYPLSYKNQTHLQNLQSVCKPYGIEVVDEVGNTKRGDFEIKPTDILKNAIVDYLKKNRLLIGDDENGNIVIRRPGSAGESHDSLQLGKNVLAGKRSTSHDKLFSEYIVLGQGTNPNSELSVGANQLKAVQKNAGVNRMRSFCKVSSGNATQQGLNKQVAAQCAVTSGGVETISYDVQGWRQSNGELWKINKLTIINDSWLGFTGNLLISSVKLVLDGQGMKTALILQPPLAFENLDLADDTKTKVATFSDVLAGSGNAKDTKWASS